MEAMGRVRGLPNLLVGGSTQQLHDEIGMQCIKWTLDKFLYGVGIGLLHIAHFLEGRGRGGREEG